MKTKLPINLYFTTISSIAFGVLLCPGHLFKILFYILFTFFCLYVFLSRRSGTIEVKADEIEIRYFFPWNKPIKIVLSSVSDVDYQKGFYDVFSDKSIGGVFVFPKYCYDRLVFTKNDLQKNTIIQVDINTRRMEFDKVVAILRNKLGNTKI